MSVPVSIHRISDISFFFRFSIQTPPADLRTDIVAPSLKRTGSGMIAEVRPSGCEPFLRSESRRRETAPCKAFRIAVRSDSTRQQAAAGRSAPGCSPRLRPIFLHRLVHLALGVVLLEVLALIVGLAPRARPTTTLASPRSLRKSRKPTTVNPLSCNAR